MSGDLLQTQDDILQMMFWMRGEHLGDTASAEQLNRFLKLPQADVDSALTRLLGRELVVRLDGGDFQLTETGISEGKRRFMDEFSGFLGKDTHLSCSDPDCDCGGATFDGSCLSLRN